MAQRILFVTGGSGGHVFPTAAVIAAATRQAQASGQLLELQLLGEGRFIAPVAAELGIPTRSIIGIGMRRYASFQNIIDIFKFPIVVCQALYRLWLFMPDLVFIKGPGSALVVGLAARLLFIPIVIHESDVIPSLTNRILSRFARKVLVAFEDSQRYFKTPVTVVGNPIRPELLVADKQEALAFFRLTDQKPTVLVVGGSQGAASINQIVMESVIELTTNFQIIHQSGEGNYPQTEAWVKQIEKEGQSGYGRLVELNYRPYPFLTSHELALAYTLADVVISRAGAGSLFEIAAVGKPLILVPLPGSAADHQAANAQEIARYGAIVIDQQNFTRHILLHEIEQAYAKRDQLAQQIKPFAKIDSAEIIARELVV